MEMIQTFGQGLIALVQVIYNFLWGDLITIPLPGGGSAGLSLLVLILTPVGIYFTVRTRFVLVRQFPEMLRIAVEKKQETQKNSISGLQALIVSTATRVGMGNLVGVVAAISAGGAGAVFWMWVMALLGSSTAFAEATLAQLYRQKDPLYGGYRGGPAYYIHAFVMRKKKHKRKKSVLAALFALSGLICWCGISQVISNSVTSAVDNAFSIPPLYTTIALVVVAAVIVLRKNATVKVLDVMVPVMAGCYFLMTLFVIVRNAGALPAVFERIFAEAFGLRQVAAGGFGAVLMNGVKRGLFSNEAGSGSAPCAAAAADVTHPAKAGLLQAFGVFVDTIVICSCSAMIMLLAPAEQIKGLAGMDLLQEAMRYHFGDFGVVFIAVILLLFSFSTFIGILFYARSNVAYLFGDNWTSQTVYKCIALVMLFIGGLAAYTFVWDLGDVGIGLMTIFNMVALLPLSGEAVAALKDYEKQKRKSRQD
ncbi:amino acid carrier protein [Marvinbryantia formatexigens DSM 14469]|uniref:Amino acid carrier protein n=1 Tax=Marvinbryantia formatexigens DSM 14469 TaxID=478749 RepID=C6LHK7_9FIRM|nr:alanine/glycine:cation symporter family protein [Marvinbryantia formatexigens]EET59994.1 amino acid carrier protein [Marvinbryantia formatexigens DSM 14469]UWO25853.1 alanine:cation symporter family protein [Marvinbryantia formatexigens DSM 14469]SDF40218.1 alanine or glycine:cation symporter, AGCS family [Marvinbryantia formatexigens]